MQRKDETVFGDAPFLCPTDIGERAAPAKSHPIDSDLPSSDYAALEVRWIDH